MGGVGQQRVEEILLALRQSEFSLMRQVAGK